MALEPSDSRCIYTLLMLAERETAPRGGEEMAEKESRDSYKEKWAFTLAWVPWDTYSPSWLSVTVGQETCRHLTVAVDLQTKSSSKCLAAGCCISPQPFSF